MSLLMGGCDGAPVGPGPAPTAVAASAPAAASLPAPRQIDRVLFSGHSLLNRPLPDYAEALAAAQGRPLDWEQQNHFGTLIRQRTRGEDRAAPGWAGYRFGDNRQGKGLDVAAALSAPRQGTAGFDALVVTERHDILWVMLNEDSTRYLRHMHDRLIQGNPRGVTLLYESWQGVAPDATSEWIRYERRVGTAWQCLASRVNASLALQGRSDRVESLPAGRALALLVERALAPGGVEGVTGASEAETLKRLFTDDVHLTELGFYYMAAVTQAFLRRSPPTGQWAPPSVPPATASALRNVAWQAYETLAGQVRADLDPKTCGEALLALCPDYWAYIERQFHAHGQSRLSARYTAWKLQRQCEATLQPDHPANPMRLDPATDAAYWFRAD